MSDDVFQVLINFATDVDEEGELEAIDTVGDVVGVGIELFGGKAKLPGVVAEAIFGYAQEGSDGDVTLRDHSEVAFEVAGTIGGGLAGRYVATIALGAAFGPAGAIAGGVFGGNYGEAAGGAAYDGVEALSNYLTRDNLLPVSVPKENPDGRFTIQTHAIIGERWSSPTEVVLRYV